MKKEITLLITQIVTYIISIVLIFTWYDWKLLIILIFFVWASNIQMRTNIMNEIMQEKERKGNNEVENEN